jgi:hypothetical protein
MTGLWLAVAWFTVHNPLFDRCLQRWGRWLLPPIPVLLGAWILWENGTLAGLVAGPRAVLGRILRGLAIRLPRHSMAIGGHRIR